MNLIFSKCSLRGWNKKMQGLTSKSYLTKGLLNKIFKKDLSPDEVDDLVLSGKLIKKFSYYQPSEELLRDLGIIPDVVTIPEENFSDLAKGNAFLLKEIAEIFGYVHVDVARIIARKYFYKKHNYWYKNEVLSEKLIDGEMDYVI